VSSPAKHARHVTMEQLLEAEQGLVGETLKYKRNAL